MDIVKNDNVEIELINDNKCLKFSLNNLDNLKLSLSIKDKEKLWINENFEVSKEDKEVYNAIDGLFLSYGDTVYFDVEGAELMLNKDNDAYTFYFFNEFSLNKSEISSVLVDETMENNSMKQLFLRLQNIEPSVSNNKENVKTLSKSLNNILKK